MGAAIRALGVVMFAGVLAVGGCAPSPDQRAADGPVSVVHAFGVTTVDATPGRVVALGDQWTDAALALGVTPVGWLGTEGAPWTPEALSSARRLDATATLIDQISALRPDLILLDLLPGDRATYDALAGLAPTIPRDPGSGWRGQLMQLGTVLRRTDIAGRLLAEYDATVAEAVRAHPGLAGRRYAVTWLAGADQVFALTGPSAAAAEVFTRLGLRTADGLANRPAYQGHVVLAAAEFGAVDADLLLAGFSPGLDEKYRGLPGYADIPATVSLSTVELAGVEQPTALSAAHLLHRLLPVLGAAAG